MSAALLSMCLCLAAADPAGRPMVVIVVGAPGAPEYETEFRRWAGLWQAAADQGGAESVVIGESAGDDVSDRDRLRSVLAEKSAAGGEPLWLVLIGHGTFDGRDAKFNLRGPDVADRELAEWLAPAARPLVVLNCSSASGPFLNRLSGRDRVVITATRSGSESNFARFGGYLAEAIGSPEADLDKDDQVSVLEAFLTAGGRAEEFYRSDARLATEHALLDDNGDGLGTPADWFRGVRASKRAKEGAAIDGVRAHQLHLIASDRERAIPPEIRRRRDELELAIASLRDEKERLGEDAYYERLEALTVEMARLYEGLQEEAASPAGTE